MQDTIDHIMKYAIYNILKEEDSYYLNILINTSHLKYKGMIQKGKKNILLIINKQEQKDMIISKESFSFVQISEDGTSILFKIPYDAILSIFMPEYNFFIEREKTILYKIFQVKKNIDQIEDSKPQRKKSTIIDINKFNKKT